MKNLLFTTTLSLLITYTIQSQCTDTKQITYQNGSFGEYKGCLDDNGNPGSGSGVEKNEIYIMEGIWDSGKLNDENGKTTFIADNSIYIGLYESGKLIKGTYFKEDDNTKIEYKGDFDSFFFQGVGVLEITETSYKTIKKGKFFKDELFEGEEVVTFSNGLIITKKTESGKLVEEKRNNTNYYNPDDVIGDEEFCIVPLKNIKENGGVSFGVPMEINGINGEWVFDTGAQISTIGKRMFSRFKKEGITYKDLNNTIKIIGVGGESVGKTIVLDKIKIGCYTLNNFKVNVSNDNNYSLLGTDFLNKFKNVEWNMKKNELKLIK
jgi:clan AA aspartic protease (TIGR02281 family)